MTIVLLGAAVASGVLGLAIAWRLVDGSMEPLEPLRGRRQPAPAVAENSDTQAKKAEE